MSPTNKNGWTPEALYLDVEKELIQEREDGTLTNAREDNLLEAMDFLWQHLTDEQRVAADRRAQEYFDKTNNTIRSVERWE